ncbi:MAG TPA: adenosine deaminase [Terriglobia bacterium]|nr:adenosine deaminase [Terriglobia bacterium]
MLRPDNPADPAAGRLTALESLIHSLPKAELHVHLEGSVEPETLRELSRAKGRLEKETEAWIQEHERCGFRYGSLPEFLNAFKLIALLLESPSDYALVATRLLERLTEQNVRYAEITLSAGVILWKGQSLPETFEAIAEAAQAFESRSSLWVQWIFDAVRQFGAEPAREVLDWARKFRSEGVIAFGIGGDEARGPAELFGRTYHEAAEMGLHRTAHAGESGNATSVRQAVEILGAERIGHGFAAAQDRDVMELLRVRKIPLEVCLTSNVCTGLIKSIQDHPLKEFLDAGLRVTLNTDDPALFGTTLEREMLLAAQAFGLSAGEIADLCRNAIQVSFASSDEKESLLSEFETAAARVDVGSAEPASC